MASAQKQVREPKPKWIIRASHHEQAYFLMARTTAQDSNLSWAARGMLVYLLSKPDDWRVNIKDLQQGCGRDKVYNLLDELIKARYVARSKTQVIDYYVYEVPLPENTEVIAALPENPYTGIPDPENTDAYIIQSKEQNTENTSLPEVVITPPAVVKEVALKKPSINQCLKDAIAIHVQEIAPDEGTAMTGLLANKALAVWKRKRKKTSATALDYAEITASIPVFVKWYNTVGNPGKHMATTLNAFEDYYTKFPMGWRANQSDALAEFGLDLKDMIA